MKRTTVIQYLEVICASLVVLICVSVFTVVEYFKDNIKNCSLPILNMSNSQITVIIDAGHGGEDGGAVGIGGTVEKDINLSIASKLQELFSMTDINVIMTRTEDKLLYNQGQEHSKKRYDILNRVEIASKYPDGIFVSIHQNKFPLENYSGLQVYYSPNNSESEIIAKKIQDNTVMYLQNRNNRQIKPAGRNILLLDRLQIPAVLVECGFLSNSEEEKMLCDEEYQQKIAYMIFISVIESECGI